MQSNPKFFSSELVNFSQTFAVALELQRFQHKRDISIEVFPPSPLLKCNGREEKIFSSKMNLSCLDDF